MKLGDRTQTTGLWGFPFWLREFVPRCFAWRIVDLGSAREPQALAGRGGGLPKWPSLRMLEKHTV
jgi:hypothetical protein